MTLCPLLKAWNSRQKAWTAQLIHSTGILLNTIYYIYRRMTLSPLMDRRMTDHRGARKDTHTPWQWNSEPEVVTFLFAVANVTKDWFCKVCLKVEFNFVRKSETLHGLIKYKWELWPTDCATGNVGGSTKSIRFTLWTPCIRICTKIHGKTSNICGEWGGMTNWHCHP